MNINYYSGRIGIALTMMIFFNYQHNVHVITKTHRTYIDLTPIRIGVVIGSMLALDVVDCGFVSRWGKNKDNTICMGTHH